MLLTVALSLTPTFELSHGFRISANSCLMSCRHIEPSFVPERSFGIKLRTDCHQVRLRRGPDVPPLRGLLRLHQLAVRSEEAGP